jgi:hypothetical protein
MALPFTKANAVQMSRKSHEQRRINQAMRENALTRPTLISPDSGEPDPYVSVELTRARAHISRINSMLDKEQDAQQLERLARALNVLSERERVLAGRPLPGSRKPAPERSKPKAPIYAMPIEAGSVGSEEIS